MVNINDMKSAPIPIEDDRLGDIFARQRELMEKYHHIERDNGLLQTEDVPVNLHHRMGQARLKDMAWRLTEELGEALDAYYNNPDHYGHYQEEMADALHFLVEFTILAGFDPEDIVEKGAGDRLSILYADCLLGIVSSTEPLNSFSAEIGELIRSLGMACNHLKNKPWKVTEMMTDVHRFYERVLEVWGRFIRICIHLGIEDNMLYNLYHRKSQVNKFRQRSGY